MKKLSHVKWFVLGVVLTLVMPVLVVPALAANASKEATLYYRDIKITLNDQPVVAKDAAGNEVEPFIIDGTTYLPVRGVAGILGIDVGWDSETNTVKLYGDRQLSGEVKVTGASLFKDDDGDNIRVAITNNLDVNLDKVMISAYCYDENDVVIGTRAKKIFMG